MISKKIALIPSYKPVEVLLEIASELYDNRFFVIVVNDGSPAEFDAVFEKLTGVATVLRHEKNEGKGEALKTGFRYIRKNVIPPYTVVTVDADGQHRIPDVLRVFEAAENHPGDLVLGSRQLDKSAPIKSRIGNGITNFLHTLTTGMKMIDTQTGLRAFSNLLISQVIDSGGSKYEYETFMLLNFSRQKNIIEVPIETVYIDNNSASHFRPFKDSARLYRVYFRYAFLKNSVRFNRTKR